MNGYYEPPGEVVNHAELTRKLMFRLWQCTVDGKGAVLTAESARYAFAAMQLYYVEQVQFRPFASGMHFRVQEWSPTKLAKTVAIIENVTVAHAAFEGAVVAYPNSLLTLQHGAQLMKTAGVDKDENWTKGT